MHVGLSLVAGNKGYFLVAVLRVPIAATSPVMEHGFWGAGASVIMVLEISCSAACGIFPDQELNPCPLHWQVDS